ncbi:MAG: YneF family protein [Erysipelotrichales bacterium]|nr:YneF family protein [Erysipelotrichales bacterium]
MIWQNILYLLLGAAIGGFLGFFFTRRAFEKQQKENPPVNEKMIRAMFMQMGRKPSEAQIKAVMKSMTNAK